MKNIKVSIKDVQDYFIMKIIDKDFKIINFDLVDDYYDWEILIDGEFYFNFSIAKNYTSIIQHYQGVKFINLNVSTNVDIYKIFLDYSNDEISKFKASEIFKILYN